MRQVTLVATQTFKEIYQSKILLNVFILGLAIAVAIFVSSEMTFGTPARIGLDIGLGALSLSSIAIAIFMGSTLIEKEIKNRTLYMIISRPVSRVTFYLGKMAGLSAILLINILLLFCFVMLLYFSVGGKFHYLIPWSLVFIYLEAVVVLFCVVFLSLVSNTIIAVLFTLTIYVAGHAVESVKETSMFLSEGSLSYFVEYYSKLMPNLSKFNIKAFVLYDGALSNTYLFSSLIYGLLWIAIFSAISIFIVNRKDFS